MKKVFMDCLRSSASDIMVTFSIVVAVAETDEVTVDSVVVASVDFVELKSRSAVELLSTTSSCRIFLVVVITSGTIEVV